MPDNESQNTLRKKRKWEKHRKEILESAKNLFSEKGFENTTMDQIANRADVSKGTLYNYFVSKDALILAIAAEGYEKLADMFEGASLPGRTGLEEVEAMGKAYYTFSRTNPLYHEAIHRVGNAGNLSLTQNELTNQQSQTQEAQEFSRQFQRFLDIWLQGVQRGYDDRSIAFRHPPAVLALLLGAVTSGVAQELPHRLPILSRFDVQEEEVMNLLFKLLGDGLKPRN